MSILRIKCAEQIKPILLCHLNHSYSKPNIWCCMRCSSASFRSLAGEPRDSPLFPRAVRYDVTAVSSSLNLHGPRLISQGFISQRCASTSSSSSEDQDNFIIVYQGPLSKMIKRLKRFSLLSSFLGLCMQPTIIAKAWGNSAIAGVGLGLFTSFFVFGTPLLIHTLTKRYVTELKFDKDTKVFKAKVLTLFCMEDVIEFTAKDVHIPDIPGPFTTLVANGRPLFIDQRTFEDPDVYEHLMGYDKPVDLRLSMKTKNEGPDS